MRVNRLPVPRRVLPASWPGPTRRHAHGLIQAGLPDLLLRVSPPYVFTSISHTDGGQWRHEEAPGCRHTSSIADRARTPHDRQEIARLSVASLLVICSAPMGTATPWALKIVIDNASAARPQRAPGIAERPVPNTVVLIAAVAIVAIGVGRERRPVCLLRTNDGGNNALGRALSGERAVTSRLTVAHFARPAARGLGDGMTSDESPVLRRCTSRGPVRWWLPQAPASSR